MESACTPGGISSAGLRRRVAKPALQLRTATSGSSGLHPHVVSDLKVHKKRGAVWLFLRVHRRAWKNLRQPQQRSKAISDLEPRVLQQRTFQQRLATQLDAAWEFLHLSAFCHRLALFRAAPVCLPFPVRETGAESFPGLLQSQNPPSSLLTRKLSMYV